MSGPFPIASTTIVSGDVGGLANTPGPSTPNDGLTLSDNTTLITLSDGTTIVLAYPF